MGTRSCGPRSRRQEPTEHFSIRHPAPCAKVLAARRRAPACGGRTARHRLPPGRPGPRPPRARGLRPECSPEIAAPPRGGSQPRVSRPDPRLPTTCPEVGAARCTGGSLRPAGAAGIASSLIRFSAPQAPDNAELAPSRRRRREEWPASCSDQGSRRHAADRVPDLVPGSPHRRRGERSPAPTDRWSTESLATGGKTMRRVLWGMAVSPAQPRSRRRRLPRRLACSRS